MQEEIRWITRDGTSYKHDDEENHALDRKRKKWKGSKSQSKGDSYQGSKKKDFSKIIFFYCHELGHYATKCPRRKADKKPSRGVESEALAS